MTAALLVAVVLIIGCAPLAVHVAYRRGVRRGIDDTYDYFIEKARRDARSTHGGS